MPEREFSCPLFAKKEADWFTGLSVTLITVL
jgi:hypothetical protein